MQNQCNCHEKDASTDDHHDLLLEKQLILCNILIYNMVYLRNLAKGTNWEQRI